jgi:hypothetical protein
MTSGDQETPVVSSKDENDPGNLSDWSTPSSPTVMDGSDIAAATLANVPASKALYASSNHFLTLYSHEIYGY